KKKKKTAASYTQNRLETTKNQGKAAATKQLTVSLKEWKETTQNSRLVSQKTRKGQHPSFKIVKCLTSPL
ncbi:hypothetical protein VIGAN_03136900, partial [Vigna angularis var. angularis]